MIDNTVFSARGNAQALRTLLGIVSQMPIEGIYLGKDVEYIQQITKEYEGDKELIVEFDLGDHTTTLEEMASTLKGKPAKVLVYGMPHEIEAYRPLLEEIKIPYQVVEDFPASSSLLQEGKYRDRIYRNASPEARKQWDSFVENLWTLRSL